MIPVRAAAALYCIAAVISPARSDDAVPSAKPVRTFTFRLAGEPETLDWNRAHTTVETYLLMNLMEGLVAFDKDLSVVPALAKSWTRSEDGRVFTFKLREGVKWSDGAPLKAQDFVFSWKRLLSPVTAASYAYFLFDIEGAELFNKGALQDFSEVGIKALDDLTFQVKLARPVAYWLYIPTFWVTFPIRQDVVEKHGEAWSKPGRMVTLGPYSLAEHDLDSKIVLKANPGYYGKKGNLDQITGLIVKDDSTALSLYESGKFDFLTDLSTLDLKRLESRADFRRFPYLKVGYLGFTVNKFPLTNVKVRRAIAMSIDKRKIPEILHGGQQPAGSLVPPKVLGHSATMGLPFNPGRAKAEMLGAGFRSDHALRLELVTPNWDKQVTLAQFIQAELKKNLGLEIVIETFDHKTFRAQLDLHAYPLFEHSWGADYPDPDNFLSIFLSSSGNNRTTWKKESFDERVLVARNLLEPKAREKAYLDAQRMLIEEEAVILPLYYEPNVALVRPRVRGLELNPLNYLYLRKVDVAP